MPQGFQLANPRMRFFDANGEPLALGKLYPFAAGTSTPLAIYQNSDLSTPHPLPYATLSASGEITIFVAAATLYKFDLFSAADVHQSGWPVDGVEALPAPDPPAPTPSPVPPGGVIWSPYSTTPSGFLPLNGAVVSRITYAALNALAAADGYPNGAGDGSTTFGLADTTGRALYGKAASGTGSTLGGTFGAIDHTHTGPSHTHTTTLNLTHNHGVTIASHTHDVTVPRGDWPNVSNAPSVGSRLVLGDSVTTYFQPSGDRAVTSAGTVATATTSNTDPGVIAGSPVTSSASGTGITGTGNPPGIVGYWFIKY